MAPRERGIVVAEGTRFHFALASILALAACDGPPPPSDGGPPDGATDAGMDSSVVDCTAPSECDDGVFCNGAETCEPGSAQAGPDGCVPGEPPCADGEVCDEEAGACEADCSVPDADGDGEPSTACGGDDCDDEDGNRYPGNPEICDAAGHDEDCDTDTICSTEPGVADCDEDADGFVSSACFNTREDGTENRGDDCDDATAAVSPDATEVCDGRDTDCDGVIDGTVGGPGPIGSMVYYEDADGDGFGNPGVMAEACTPPAGFVTNDDDCYDGSSDVRPTQTAFFSRPACRNGVEPTHGPPVMCPAGEPDCWVCDDRRAMAADFDFNCDGSAEPQAETSCFVVPPSCVGGRGPDGAHTAAQCGAGVPFVDCRTDSFGGCDVRMFEDRLPCR